MGSDRRGPGIDPIIDLAQLHALLALIRVQRATRSAARPDAAATCQPLGH